MLSLDQATIVISVSFSNSHSDKTRRRLVKHRGKVTFRIIAGDRIERSIPHLGHIWCFSREIVECVSGRFFSSHLCTAPSVEKQNESQAEGMWNRLKRSLDCQMGQRIRSALG
jgi:hypothetical protein